LLFYPKGLDLIYHNFAWLNITIWLTLRSWVGGFAAYNLAILLNLIFTGFSAYMLVLELTGDRRASFVGGLIYLAWPFRLSQLDHPNLISTQWIPLFLLFLIRVLHRGRLKDGAAMGLFIVLAAYTRWQLLIPAVLMGGILLLLGAKRDLIFRREQLLSIAFGVLIAVIALVSPLRLFVMQQNTQPADLLVDNEEYTMQTDLLAYLTPGSLNPLVGGETATAYDRYYYDRSDGRRFPAYLGVITLCLSVVGLFRVRRVCLPWAVSAMLLVAIALGPVLRINGQLYPAIPMPYRLLGKLYVPKLMRFPDRFNMFLSLPLAVMAGFGLVQVRTWVVGSRDRWAESLLTIVIGALIGLEYLAIPVPMQDIVESGFYSRLAQDSEPYAIFNLPIGPQASKEYMFAQTQHRHPILQGKTARFLDGTLSYIQSHPLLRDLQQDNEISPALTDLSALLNSLADDGVKYIILHKKIDEPTRIERWKRFLGISPQYEDESIVVYTTRPTLGRDYELISELAPNVGPVQILVSTDCLNPGRAWEVDILWGTTMNVQGDYFLELALESVSGEIISLSSFPITDKSISTTWPKNTLAWTYYRIEALAALEEGTYKLVGLLSDSTRNSWQKAPFSLQRVSVQQTPCMYSLPTDAVRTNALFGSDLLLSGYRISYGGQDVGLTLFWRSEQRMIIDYKVFVHLYDPDNGVPVAQDDAMPLQWGYPTTLWTPGEMVTDTISLSLDGVAAGEYGLAVGVYSASTDRLPVLLSDGQSVLDGRLILEPGGIIVY
jgi:hypothetical protein